mgnify:CR=1 FL=1
MNFIRFWNIIKLLCIGLFLGVFMTNAYAVHDNGVFELDGNAFEEEVVGDDWEVLHNGGGSASVFTGITADPSPLTIFTGGRKDIQYISQWSHKHGSVPDKDDLTNAYAAAYGVPNEEEPPVDELVVYFGADRFANVGDAFMGFWFFQDEVVALADGSFSGEHKPNDTLVLVDYPQGANEVPYIAVVVWDTNCPKAASNNPSPGDCAAKNLRMKAESDSELGSAECGQEGDDEVCAITNDKAESSPWSYTPKAGVSGTFPAESFYEGGINLTRVIGGETCFSSFMAETRSSSSFTAALKDFVLDDFLLCGIEIVKTCPTGDLVSSGDAIEYQYKLEVTNTGFGTLYDIMATDITAGEQTPVGAYQFNSASLAAGASVEYTGSFITITNGIRNYASVTAAVKTGGGVAVDASDDILCPGLSTPGELSVTKDCSTVVEQNAAGNYGLRVNYSGKVCNDSKVKMEDVILTEIHDGLFDVINIGDLAPKSCEDYSGSYIPTPQGDELATPLPGNEVRAFTDTVDAFGYTVIFGDLVEALQAEASCKLCPDCPDCPTE